MNRDFDSILEQSLSQIAAGKARVESCLLAYPAYADELEPLLRAAEGLRTLPRPTLTPEAQARIEARVLGPPKASRRFGLVLPPIALPRLPQLIPAWRWAFAGLAAAAVLVLVMLSLIYAASDSLPGSPLYQVKLASEKVWLWATPTQDRPALHLRLAERRIDEIKALVSQGELDPAVVDAMIEEMEMALALAEDLPPEQAEALLEAFLALAEYQESELRLLLSSAPEGVLANLTRALMANADQVQRAQALLRAVQEEQPGDAEETPATAQPTEPTRTPTPSATSRTPTPIATPTATELVGTPEPAEMIVTAPPAEPVETQPPTEPTESTAPEPTEPPAPEPTEPPAPEPTDDVVNTPPAWGLTKTAEPPAWGLTPEPKPTKTPKPNGSSKPGKPDK